MLAWLYFVNLRYLVVGGGDELPLVTVVMQALSLAVGGSPAEPLAAIVAMAVLVAAGAALYLLYRSGSDLWLPFAAGIFVFPAVALLVTRPAVIYPRYFLVSMLFLQLLISWLLVRLFHQARYGKVLYALFLAAILVGNATATARLLAVGRGGYQAALRFMLEHASDSDLTVGSDHDFRNRLVLQYYFPRSGSNRHFVYYALGQWPQAGPEWVVTTARRHPSRPRRRSETIGEHLLAAGRFPILRPLGLALGGVPKRESAGRSGTPVSRTPGAPQASASSRLGVGVAME